MTDEVQRPNESRPHSQALSDADELLFRQVHPAMVQAGQVGSHAFLPSREHGHQLSVDRSSLTNAEDAHSRHTKTHASKGVWAISVAECSDAELAAYPDPVPENEAHARIDFEPLGTKAKRRAAKRLRRAANDRGPIFVTDPSREP